MINQILFFFVNTITVFYYYNKKIITLECQVMDLNKQIENIQLEMKLLKNDSAEKDEKLQSFISSAYLI
jgi:hypothetical protein